MESFSSVVDSFVSQHINDKVGAANFRKFMMSLYDIDEAEPLLAYEPPPDDKLTDSQSPSAAGPVRDARGRSVSPEKAEKAGHAPLPRCTEEDKGVCSDAMLVEHFEQFIITPQAWEVLEKKLEATVAALTEENESLESQLRDRYQNPVNEVVAKAINQMAEETLGKKGQKRKLQTQQWRACLNMMDELMLLQ